MNDFRYNSVCQIAVKSPVLIANENLKTEMIDNTAIKTDSLPSVKFKHIKNKQRTFKQEKFIERTSRHAQCSQPRAQPKCRNFTVSQSNGFLAMHLFVVGLPN
jgi:hypothetical protein